MLLMQINSHILPLPQVLIRYIILLTGIAERRWSNLLNWGEYFIDCIWWMLAFPNSFDKATQKSTFIFIFWMDDRTYHSHEIIKEKMCFTTVKKMVPYDLCQMCWKTGAKLEGDDNACDRKARTTDVFTVEK